jgi:hypothetical protein
MAKKDVPIATVTNPILLWLFRHGWEDPGWGQSPMDRLTIALAIHDLAAKVADRDARKQIQSVAARAVAKAAQAVVKESV